MIQDDKSGLYAEAILGKDAEEFWISELGQYIINRSKEETDVIINELKTAKPRELKALQDRWEIAEKALIWLNDAIRAGTQAIETLEDLQDR